jgi:hypothetical protein
MKLSRSSFVFLAAPTAAFTSYGGISLQTGARNAVKPQSREIVVLAASGESRDGLKMIRSEPVLAAVNSLNDRMMASHEKTIEILKRIDSGFKDLNMQCDLASENVHSHQINGATSSDGHASAGPAPTTTSYLQQMSGGSGAVRTGPTGNYAPTKSTVSKKSGGAGFGSYLDSF